MIPTRTLIVRDSRNQKTGRVALATYRTQASCPTSCAMYGAGCYAENRGMGGRPSPFGQVEASTGPRSILGTDYAPLIEALAAIRPQSMVRFNVSGDYLLADGTPDLAYIDATNTAAAHDHSVLSYTHAWRILSPDLFHDKTRPQASCDSVHDVADALAAGWAPVIVDPDGRYAQGTRVAGATCVTCPYVTSGRQCVDCGLCARSARPSLVVFPVHGSRKRRAADSLVARSDGRG